MKNKILILACVIVTLNGIVIMREKIILQKGTLYHQDVLLTGDENNQEEKTFITRGEAIETAYENFKNGLGVDLESKDLSMVINLSCDKGKADSYKWVMSWYKEGTYTAYSCTMDAVTGEIISIYAMNPKKVGKKEFNKAVKEEEVLDIVSPLLEELGIKVSDYNVLLPRSMESEEAALTYKRCTFVNKMDIKNSFSIELDGMTKTLVSYEAETGE